MYWYLFLSAEPFLLLEQNFLWLHSEPDLREDRSNTARKKKKKRKKINFQLDQFPTLSHCSAVQTLMLAQWNEWQRRGNGLPRQGKGDAPQWEQQHQQQCWLLPASRGWDGGLCFLMCFTFVSHCTWAALILSMASPFGSVLHMHVFRRKHLALWTVSSPKDLHPAAWKPQL